MVRRQDKIGGTNLHHRVLIFPISRYISTRYAFGGRAGENPVFVSRRKLNHVYQRFSRALDCSHALNALYATAADFVRENCVFIRVNHGV